MPVAMQTMPWGRRPDVATMLEEIHEAGYDGVEIGQIPSVFRPIPEFSELLINNQLALVGVASGSLEEKIDFVREFVSHRQQIRLEAALAGVSRDSLPASNPPYIYIDDGESRHITAALEQGYRLALHPHMFKPFQTVQEFEQFFMQSAYDRLTFLPDTAHLTVAGEDIVRVIERFYDRIEAIHFKDWKEEWGRAYAFYSRGFTELGSGDVRLTDLVSLLKSRNYRKWLVVEQDASNDPAKSATQSRLWLKRRLM